MELSDKKGVQQIVAALRALGLREVIICPGSRNAPLTISFNRHPGFTCTSIRDERSAAFFALGKVIELSQPVAILSTSGSAVLNFGPAISEAFYQRLPLIVITADRLKEWTGQGDGQTIDQTNVFRNYIRKSFELRGEAESPSDLWYNDRCLSEGWHTATQSDPGPVHFNIPLSEPLYQTAAVQDVKPRIFRMETPERLLSPARSVAFAKAFASANKVMIIAGQHRPDEHYAIPLVSFALSKNTIVLTESTSNVQNRLFIENIDRCITGFDDAGAKEFMPDLLVTVGGAVVSKRIKALLRKYKPAQHWNVDLYDCQMDTYQSLTHAIPMTVPEFFYQIGDLVEDVTSSYRQKWIDLEKRMEKLHEEFCSACEFSDLKVFYRFYQQLPEGISLHLANSSPIRYAQLFNNERVAETWSNRGTSGIDGCTSTVVGAAAASPGKNFVLITGDVAFHYDINGLWNNEKIHNLKIIVINNSGGGIFRIISGPPKVDELEAFFETTMHSDAEKLAGHYHWNYLSARDDESLQKNLKEFFDPRKERIILEIFTDAEKNPEVLDKYWRYLKEK